MLSPVWVDATKLENVSQYATLKRGIVDSNFGLKFQKIKIDILKSSSLVGIFHYKEQADTVPLIESCESFQLSIIKNMPARKRKLGIVKSCRDYNTPNFCNLYVPINRNTVVVLLSCNFPYRVVHTDRLSAC